MSKKLHLKVLRFPHWTCVNSVSSVTKQDYANLWSRQLYLQMWMQRVQLTGIPSAKNKWTRKSKSGALANLSLTSLKTNFGGTSVFSWSQYVGSKRF